jgi:uncharacterized spore protein YtfJ
MNNQVESFTATVEKSAERVSELLGKLTLVAQPGAVFSEPITAHDHTIITASEVTVGMGVAFGSGGGTDGSARKESANDKDTSSASEGGGGGGGGGSMGRPVAVISVGPGGVRVEPVVDPTKIALAFFTMLGAIFMSWRAMRRFGRTN